MKKKLVVLSGAGISAESGIKTFRDSNGLWENHKIEDVASPEGWHRNKELVLNFYNQRRAQLTEVLPNKAHTILAELENDFDVTIITQNVDDLHERGGSKKIIHLHGELIYARSTVNYKLRYNIGYNPINLGDKCAEGSQLRPDIVWFGEAVPKMMDAADITLNAAIFLVIGTSLEVYPAAGLIDYTPSHCAKYIIDPNRHENKNFNGIYVINKTATDGMEIFREIVLNNKNINEKY